MQGKNAEALHQQGQQMVCMHQMWFSELCVPSMRAEMSTQELMTKGRKEMQAQEDSLIRAQRIVESTIEVGTKTAETLHQQGQQMERVLDALEEIKFSMNKANQVIRDITRSIATDKCGPFSLPRCSHRHARSRHDYGIFSHLLLHMSCCMETQSHLNSMAVWQTACQPYPFANPGRLASWRNHGRSQVVLLIVSEIILMRGRCIQLLLMVVVVAVVVVIICKSVGVGSKSSSSPLPTLQVGILLQSAMTVQLATADAGCSHAR